MTRISVVLFLLSLVLAASESPSWGQGGMPLIIPDDDLIVDTDDDVLIAKVAGVSNHKATWANPPRVVLHVEETIRGPKHKQLEANWECPYDPESDNPDGPEITAKTRAEMRQFSSEPLDNPKAGEEWVIIGSNATDDDGNTKADSLFISAKFPLSKERRKWVDAQLKRRKQYEAECIQYRDQWPKPLNLVGASIPAGAQPVESETKLRPGMQLLLKWATTTQCSVIEVLDKGQVKVRPHGYDSRRDAVVSRDKLMLYPAKVIEPK